MIQGISILHLELSKAVQSHKKKTIKAQRLIEIITMLQSYYTRANLIQKANTMNLVVKAYNQTFICYRKSLFNFKASLYQPISSAKKIRRSKQKDEEGQQVTVRKQRKQTQRVRNEETQKKLDLYQILEQQMSSQQTEIQSNKSNLNQQLTIAKLNIPSQRVIQTQLERTAEVQFDNEDQIIQDFRSNYNQLVEDKPSIENIKHFIIPPEGASKKKQKRKTQQNHEPTKRKLKAFNRRKDAKVLIDKKINFTQGDAIQIEIQLDRIFSKTKTTKKLAVQRQSFHQYFQNISNQILNPISFLITNEKGLQILKKMRIPEKQQQFDDQQAFQAFISQKSLQSFGQKQKQGYFLSQNKYEAQIGNDIFFTPIKSQNYTPIQRQVLKMIEQQIQQGRNFNLNQYMQETSMCPNQKAKFFHRLMHLNLNITQQQPFYFSDLVINPDTK